MTEDEIRADLRERARRVIQRLKPKNFDELFLSTLAEYIEAELVAIRAEAKDEGWEDAMNWYQGTIG